MDKIIPSFSSSLFDGSKDWIGDIVEIAFGNSTSKFEIIHIPTSLGRDMPELIKIL